MPFPFLSRRLLAALAALVLLLGAALPARADFSLPALPYATDALEPAIDAATMTIHHDRHHATYVANLNAQIGANPSLAGLNLETLQGRISRFPEAVRNNGGGHWNHSQFWAVMAPVGQGGAASPELLAAITSSFGSIEAMQQTFNKAAAESYGLDRLTLALAALDAVDVPGPAPSRSDTLAPATKVPPAPPSSTTLPLKPPGRF